MYLKEAKRTTTNVISRRNLLKASLALSASAVLSGCQFALTDEFKAAIQSEGGMMDGMASVNGTTLFYTQHGSGIPVMVMHGGLGLDHAYFRPALDRLGDSASLVYFDHRGNGRSQEEANWDSITFDDLTKDADELRQALGFDKVVLYGHSYGGFIAQEYAARYQDNLAGLILSNTSPNVTDYEPVMPAWATDEAMGALGQIFSAPMETDEQWGETWSRALPLYWKDMDEDLAADIHARTQYRAAAWNRGAQLLGEFQMKGRLQDITVPTLLLSGRLLPPGL
ncbi:MAG: alpha/beta fold hydrolase [Chloroflexota bacterium]